MSTLIEIVTKSGGDVSNVSSGEITLTQPSIVKLPFGPEEVSGYEQDGNNLIVNLVSGEQEVIYGFFDAQDGERHDLVLEDGEAVVWWGQYESPWSGFTFAEIQEAAVAPVASGGGIPLWALAMGAVTTAVTVDALLDDSNTDVDEEADDDEEASIDEEADVDEDSGLGSESGENVTPPNNPTVDSLQNIEGGVVVSGEGDPGNKVIVRNEGGDILGESVVGEDGRYKVVTDEALDEDGSYEVVTIDESGNESESIPLTAENSAPTITEVTVNQQDTSEPVNGETDQTLVTFVSDDESAIYDVTSSNGELAEVTDVVPNDDGTVSVSAVFDPALSENDIVIITATNPVGNQDLAVGLVPGGQELLLELVDVNDNFGEVDGAISPIPVSQTLTGTGSVGINVEVLSPEGVVLGEFIVGDDGNWEITTQVALAPRDTLFNEDLNPINYTVKGTRAGDEAEAEVSFEINPLPEGTVDEGEPVFTLGGQLEEQQSTNPDDEELEEFSFDSAASVDTDLDDEGLDAAAPSSQSVAPVVIDIFVGSGIEYSNTKAQLPGGIETSAWVSSNEGVLIWDKFGDGSLRDLEQIAFTEFGGSTDLEGLALEFDTNRDGVLDADDEKWDEFGIWWDFNGNGLYEQNEFFSISDTPITSFNLVSDGEAIQRTEGVFEYGRSTAVNIDGSDRLIADTAFEVNQTFEVRPPNILTRRNNESRFPQEATESTITGYASPGDNVVLYKNGGDQLEFVAQTTADEFGNFTFTSEPPFEDGQSYALYSAKPDFSAFSEPVLFKGDLTVPDKAKLETITEIEVDGETKVRIEGTAEPGTDIYFLGEGNRVLLGFGSVDDEGRFSVVADPVPGGDGEFGNVYLFDNWGNYSSPGRIYNKPIVTDTYNVYEGDFQIDVFENQGAVQGTFISGQVRGADQFELDGPNILTVQVIDANGEILGESNEVSVFGGTPNQYEITTNRPLADGEEYDLFVLINGERVSLPAMVEGDTVAPQVPVIEDVSYVVDENDGTTTTVIEGKTDQVRFDGGLFLLTPNGDIALGPDGGTSGFGFPDDNNNFTLEIAGEINLSEGYKVYAFDSYRNVSGAATFGEVEIIEVNNVFGFESPVAGAEGTQVKGIARPGELVQLRDPSDDEILGVTWADENTGEFTLKTSRVLENEVSYSVSSVDENGSISIASSVVGDTEAPDAPSIELEEDTGIEATFNDGSLIFPQTFTDGITDNTTVNVSGIEEGADWYWKASPDEEWIKGEGTSFDLDDVRDDKYYNLFTPIVKQVDSYGNVSESADLTADYSQRIIDFTASLFLNDELNNRAPIGEDGEAGGTRILLEGEVVYLNSDNGLGSDGGAITGVGPVVLDIDQDGALTYSDNEVALPGLGGATTAWGGAGDGVLMWDKNADTTLTDLEQIAFTEFGGETDLEGLAIGFDSNGDGVFDANDDAFDQFGVWQDANSNGEMDAGEFLTLEEVGIVAINLESDGVESQPADGVHEFGRGSAVLADGSEMLLSDVAFDYKPFSEDEQNALSVI